MSKRSNYQKIVRRRVLQAIAFLDDVRDDAWPWDIDLVTFDITEGDQCVLGQLYNHNASGLFENGYTWARDNIPGLEWGTDDAFDGYISGSWAYDVSVTDATRILQDTWVRELRKITIGEVTT